jgi:hypothetical protein
MVRRHGIIKVYSGAPHKFTCFSPTILQEAGDRLEDSKQFIEECIGKSNPEFINYFGELTFPIPISVKEAT